MRVTVLELPATWGDPQGVLDRVDRAIAEGPATDLVVLPEASLTGYVSPDGSFDVSRFAEPLDGPTARRAADIARARGVHLVAPLVLEEDQASFNAVAIFDATGAVMTVYRKRHPWFPETWATPGRGPHPVVRIGDTSFTIAICYDVHFLAEEAAEVLRSVDLLVFPSAWVDEHDTRPEILSSIAKTFGVAVVNANWAEGVVRVPGQGGSLVLDARGEVLARVAPGELRADATIVPRRP